MGIAAGSIPAGAQGRPSMDLDFTVQLYRATVTSSTIGSTKRTFVKHGGVLPCSISMLTDSVLFLQSGETNQIVANMFFFENTDVQHGDIVQVLSHARLGDATTGNYYAVEDTISPTADGIGFIRAHVSVGKEPAQAALR